METLKRPKFNKSQTLSPASWAPMTSSFTSSPIIRISKKTIGISNYGSNGPNQQHPENYLLISVNLVWD